MATTNVLEYNNGAANSDGATVLTTGKWYLAAVTKPTGTTTPRFHIYDYTAGTWVHENGTVAVANGGKP